MFKDYYDILGVSMEAADDEIRAAFKAQALRWHPDKNKGRDTTQQMQEINEAYLILKDHEARSRYDIEYNLFKAYRNEYQSENDNSTPDDKTCVNEQYTFSDETLKKWMANAKDQAADLVSKTLQEIKIGSVAAGKEMLNQLVVFALIGTVFSVLFWTCS